MRYRAITFDVYSALFDIVSGLRTAVGALYDARGIDADAAEAALRWRRKHMEALLVANSLDREPASNRRQIELSARYALRHLTPPPVTDAEMIALAAAWERLPPWPEAGEVLRHVRGRPVILAALSNGDEASLRRLLDGLPVRFDFVGSTEGGRFKPHPWIYTRTVERLGLRASEVLHVCGSHTDAVGATAAGIPAVWVNRADEAVIDPRYAPPYQVTDLRGILPLLG